MNRIELKINDDKTQTVVTPQPLVEGENLTTEIAVTPPESWVGYDIRCLLTTPKGVLVDAVDASVPVPLTNTMLDGKGTLYVEYVAMKDGTEIARTKSPALLPVSAARSIIGDIDPAPLPDLVAEMVAAKGDCDGAAAAAVLAAERIETTDAETKAAEAERAQSETGRTTRANTDHNTAVEDHVQAGNDHIAATSAISTIGAIDKGSPSGTYATTTALAAAFPTGNANIYAVTADGGWYYWSGAAWTKGGTYQSAGVANKSIGVTKLINGAVVPEKTAFMDTGKNKFNKDTVMLNYFIASNGVLTAQTGYWMSDFIPVLASTSYVRKVSWSADYWDINYVWISHQGASTAITTPSNCAYVTLNSNDQSNINTEQLEAGISSTAYEAHSFAIKSHKPLSIPFTAFELTAKRGAYPFQPGVTFTNATHFTNILSAVKNIEIYGADPTKKYCLGIIMRNTASMGSGAYIYECNDAGVATTLVCTTLIKPYVEPIGIDDFLLAEYNNSGISAKISLDWTQIPTATNYENLSYALSGIDYRAYRETSSIKIKLPPKIFGIVGKEINVYFDNVILCDNVENYKIDVVCAVGVHQNKRWTYTPSAVGTNSLKISVYKDGALVCSSVSSVVVKAAAVGTGATKKIIFIGDSLTAAAEYTAELLVLFGAGETMDLTLIGTKGVFPNLNEGTSGTDVAWAYSNAASPFVFSGSFDFAQYLLTNALSTPDYAVIMLGTNDIFAQTTDAGLKTATTAILANLDLMIANIKSADANIKVGIAVTIPPSASQDSFGKNYGSATTRWRFKRNQFLYSKALIEHFVGQEANRIYLIPTNVNLDTENNMVVETVPLNSRNSATTVRQANGVHPATSGYNQIADTYYYWIKSLES